MRHALPHWISPAPKPHFTDGDGTNSGAQWARARQRWRQQTCRAVTTYRWRSRAFDAALAGHVCQVLKQRPLLAAALPGVSVCNMGMQTLLAAYWRRDVARWRRTLHLPALLQHLLRAFTGDMVRHALPPRAARSFIYSSAPPAPLMVTAKWACIELSRAWHAAQHRAPRATRTLHARANIPLNARHFALSAYHSKICVVLFELFAKLLQTVGSRRQHACGQKRCAGVARCAKSRRQPYAPVTTREKKNAGCTPRFIRRSPRLPVRAVASAAPPGSLDLRVLGLLQPCA